MNGGVRGQPMSIEATGKVQRVSAGTKKRPIRMPDELWDAVQAKAEAEGTNASEVIRRLLSEWLNEGEE